MSSGKHEDSVCMMVRGFAACAASLFTSFFFGILYFVSLFFLGCTCNTIVACRACEKGSRTQKTHGRVDRRGRLTVPPLHVLHVCVCGCV